MIECVGNMETIKWTILGPEMAAWMRKNWVSQEASPHGFGSVPMCIACGNEAFPRSRGQYRCIHARGCSWLSLMKRSGLIRMKSKP